VLPLNEVAVGRVRAADGVIVEPLTMLMPSWALGLQRKGRKVVPIELKAIVL